MRRAASWRQFLFNVWVAAIAQDMAKAEPVHSQTLDKSTDQTPPDGLSINQTAHAQLANALIALHAGEAEWSDHAVSAAGLDAAPGALATDAAVNDGFGHVLASDAVFWFNDDAASDLPPVTITNDWNASGDHFVPTTGIATEVSVETVHDTPGIVVADFAVGSSGHTGTTDVTVMPPISGSSSASTSNYTTAYVASSSPINEAFAAAPSAPQSGGPVLMWSGDLGSFIGGSLGKIGSAGATSGSGTGSSGVTQSSGTASAWSSTSFGMPASPTHRQDL